MNYKLSMVTLLLLTTLNANTEPTQSKENNNTKVNSLLEKRLKNEDKETQNLELKAKKLSLNNSLTEQVLKKKNSELLTKLQQLKWENQLLSEEFSLKELKAKKERFQVQMEHEQKIEELEYNARVKSIEYEKINANMEMQKTKWNHEITKLSSEVELFETSKKRQKIIRVKANYLDEPWSEDKKLTISDRRIEIDGVIRGETADEITNKINYFNNKDSKKPIFIVINDSPGGSAMAGYLILKAMKGSTAPIYVVLREYAASMAAIIVTLADKSFAYGHATILHHQPLSINFGNLTEQQEDFKRLEEWWTEFGGATAKKMGISLEEFKKEMYKHDSRGNWQELASNAVKLKWVDHIVETIVDTSVREEPKVEEQAIPKLLRLLNFQEVVNEKGEAHVYLPPLSPSDAYLLHNPNGYYQFR